MKTTIQTYDLVSALGIVTRALPARPVNQIMECVLLEADSTQLILTASDGSMTIRTGIPSMADETGNMLVPGKLLYELTKKLSGPEVTIEEDGHTAKIRSGKSRTSLALQTVKEYPEQITFDGKQHFSVPQVRLKDMIANVAHCICTDDTRVILNGILFDVTDGKLSLVALDGFRLAIANDTDTYADSISEVIPARAVNELQRLLGTDDSPCALSFTEGKLSATFNGITMTTTLLSGTYPDFHKILPDGFKTEALVKRDAMSAAIDRASLMARDGNNNLVKLSIRKDTVNVSANSPTGNADEDVSADVNGPDLDIAFNSRYLTDVFRAMPAEEATMSFNTVTSPCIIRPLNRSDRMYLVLPVRVL